MPASHNTVTAILPKTKSGNHCESTPGVKLFSKCSTRSTFVKFIGEMLIDTGCFSRSSVEMRRSYRARSSGFVPEHR